MAYLIGIDGGGSKTKIQCFDSSGRPLADRVIGTTDYHQIGVDGVIGALGDAFRSLQIDLSGCLIGFGMPVYGENKEEDEKAARQIQHAFPYCRIHFANDVYCAWAGAMAFRPGVTIVCGTGSMSVGRDSSGKLARSGGWCEFFSDEGSGYWLGKKTLEIFAKQSDHRLPRGPLYALMRAHLGISDDLEVIGVVQSTYANSRQKTASLQMILWEAQKQGDQAARQAYTQAVEEVVLITLGSVRQLDFPDGAIDISYIGGLFNEKALFLDPFVNGLNQHFTAHVHPPKLSPCHGALLFALDTFEKDRLEAMRQNFLRGQLGRNY